MKFFLNIFFTISLLTFANSNAFSQWADVSIIRVDWGSKPTITTGPTEFEVHFHYDGSDPLTELIIQWRIDGEQWNVINWTGTIEPHTDTVFVLGSRVFSTRIGTTPYYALDVELINPNNLIDENLGDNDEYGRHIYPAMQAGTYNVGNDPGDDYSSLAFLSKLMTRGGIETEGDIIINVRPDSYYVDPTEPIDFTNTKHTADFTIQKMPNTTGDVLFYTDFISEMVQGEIGTKNNENRGEQVSNDESDFKLITFVSIDDLYIDGITFEVTVDCMGSEYSGGCFIVGDILNIEYANTSEITNCNFTFLSSGNSELDGNYMLRGVNFLESWNVKFENNLITGLEPPSDPFNLILLDFFESSKIEVINNEFYFGGIGVNEDSWELCERVFTVTNNLFEDIGGFGTNLNFNPVECDDPTSSVNVSNNTINFFDIPIGNEFYGLCIYNGSTVSGNSFSGFKGNGGDTQAAIFLNHTEPQVDDPVTVSGNEINNSQDIVGIKLENIGSGKVEDNTITINNTQSSYTNAAVQVNNSGKDGQYLWVNKNDLELNNTDGIVVNDSRTKAYNNNIDISSTNSADNNSGFKSDGSVGYVANNIITGDNANGMMLMNSGDVANDADGLFFCYNSIGINSDINMGINADGAYNSGIKFYRNMVMNFGDGTAMYAENITGNPFLSDENNIRTNGNNLAYFEGADLNGLSDWQISTGQDMGSASEDVKMENNGSMIPEEFSENLFFTNPIFAPASQNYIEMEQFDAQGNQRTNGFFVGSNAPPVKVQIITQPQDIIGCNGAEAFTGVVATLDSGLDPIYTWFKDGREILNYGLSGIGFAELKFEMEGVYHCIVSGLGVATPIRTDDIIVKVLHTPNIMIQPTPQIANNGETAFFEAEANIYGNLPPYYRTQVQWYKGSVQLVNDDKISGANSTRMTISNIDDNDYADYWVALAGRCGNVSSVVVSLGPKPGIAITSQPVSVEICNDENFKFIVDANGTNGGIIQSYQWYIDGMIADENMYGGTSSATLTGTANQSLANVMCRMVVSPGDATKDTDIATLTVNNGPEFSINLADSDDKKVGEEFTATVEASGFGTLTYKWFSSVDANLDNTSATLTITDLLESHSGDYWCEVTDDCGNISSNKLALLVTKDKILLSIDETRDDFKIAPNPFNDNTLISFQLKEFANVMILISDMKGNKFVILEESRLSPSNYEYTFNAVDRNLISGSYLCTIIINGVKYSKKMSFVR